MSNTNKPAMPEPDAYLQIGMEGSPNEGDRIARTYLPKHYDKTWWRFEPLYTQAAIEAAVAEVNALNGALTDKCNSYIIANARLAEQVAEALAVPDGLKVRKVDPGFRWDGDAQQHVPQVMVEFEPVPANSPNAPGWLARDTFVAAFAATPSPAEQPKPAVIDTADTVLHKPSGESWIVAFVQDGRLCACGWPLEFVPAEDCDLIEKATPESRAKLLRQMADISESDPRRAYARAALSGEQP